MTSRATRTLIASAFAAVLMASSAFADDCKLGRIASVDFTDDGAIIVPASVEGTTVSMAIDTGSEASAIDPVVASNLHLVENRIYQDMMYNTKGEQFSYMAVFHTFKMGELHADDMKVLVWPSPIWAGRVAGLVGGDVLRNYDVDIDFGSHKVNFFSQNHCEGKVVYWTSDNVAVVPVHVLRSGHIIAPVTLDGHPVDATIDTGSTHSVLSMEFASSVLGLTSQSPDMTKVGEMSGAVRTAVYRHTFKTLGLEGLTIGSPTMLIRDNLMKYSLTQGPHIGSRFSSADVTTGITDLQLGMNELRQLHLYIAYKEQKLYITPASAPVAVAASLTPAAAAAPAGATTAPPPARATASRAPASH